MLRAGLCALAAIYLGCHAAPSPDSRDRSPSIPSVSNATFTAALFFKPAASNAPDVIFSLAPLLFLECSTNRPAHPYFSNRFGETVTLEPKPGTDAAQPTVYYEINTVELQGANFVQIGYRWHYPQRQRKETPTGWLQEQGVRLTLDSSGNPVIWEVLDDTSGRLPVFIAESMEQRARMRFGAPLPGRAHAIEPALSNRSPMTVAWIIADGPVPMGPAVYVRQESHDVATVMCRCMPPQTTRLVDTQFYRLLPRSAAPAARPKKSPREFAAPHWIETLRVLPE